MSFTEADRHGIRPRIPPRWGVIADDLTGACDCGAAFCQRGFQPAVYCRGVFPDGPTSEVVVVPTHSRSLSPDVAFQRVLQTAHQFAERQVEVVYKKIDSTLQGNLGIEIEAALQGLNRSLAVVAPAFPEMGRRLVRGELRLGQQRESTRLHLPTLLAGDSQPAIETIDFQQVAEGFPTLIGALRAAAQRGSRIAVVDAVDHSDLAAIGRACVKLADTVLGVGSAGLAYHLSDDTDSPAADSTDPPPTAPRAENVVLFIGSTNPVTDRQLQQLTADGETAFPPADFWSPTELQRALAAGQHLVVPVRWRGTQEQAHLAWILERVANWKPAGVVLSGGDTAQRICELASVEQIQITREVTRGLPRGLLRGGFLAGTPVVTKAGGFGDHRALQTACRDLCQRRAAPR